MPGYRVRIDLAIGPPWEITLGEADFLSLAGACKNVSTSSVPSCWGGILVRGARLLEVVPDPPRKGVVPACLLIGESP